MEIPSEVSGKVSKVSIKVGDEIKTGHVIIAVELDNKTKKVDTPKEIKKENHQTENDDKEANIDSNENLKLQEGFDASDNKQNFASPGVRRLSRELNINLNLINGTGLKGRISKEDLNNYIKLQMAMSSGATVYQQPEVDFSQWGDIEVQKLTKVNIITGQRLQSAWQNIPHVTQFDEADITDLHQYRQDINKKSAKNKIKLTFLPFFIKAVTMVLKEMPKFNSSLDYNEQNLILKNYFNLGIAVDTPNGLLVPVIKNVDKKSLVELSTELSDLSDRARNKKLRPEELKSGTFTISSLGGIGGKFFTPIINPPEVAILGISRSWWKDVYNQKINKQSLKYIMPFSLSYDHRVIDGVAGSTFTSRLIKVLGDISNFQDK